MARKKTESLLGLDSSPYSLQLTQGEPPTLGTALEDGLGLTRQQQRVIELGNTHALIMLIHRGKADLGSGLVTQIERRSVADFTETSQFISSSIEGVRGTPDEPYVEEFGNHIRKHTAQVLDGIVEGSAYKIAQVATAPVSPGPEEQVGLLRRIFG